MEATGSSHALEAVARRLVVVAIDVVAGDAVVVVASRAIPWGDGDAWAKYACDSADASP